VKNGEWAFELRPVAKATDSRDGFETSKSVLKAGLLKAGLKKGGKK
jgi:hypothetical protein